MCLYCSNTPCMWQVAIMYALSTNWKECTHIQCYFFKEEVFTLATNFISCNDYLHTTRFTMLKGVYGKEKEKYNLRMHTSFTRNKRGFSYRAIANKSLKISKSSKLINFEKIYKNLFGSGIIYYGHCLIIH